MVQQKLTIMKRNEFLKKLGLGALVTFTAPKLLAKEDVIYPRLPNGDIDSDLLPMTMKELRSCYSGSYKTAQLIADEDLKMGMWLPYKGNMTPLEILKIRK